MDKYQSDDLADDSEDEKNLRATEQRALAKLSSERNLAIQRGRYSSNGRRLSLLPLFQPFRGYQSFRPPFRGVWSS